MASIDVTSPLMSEDVEALSGAPARTSTVVPIARPASETIEPSSSEKVSSNMSGRCRWVSTTARTRFSITLGSKGIPSILPTFTVGQTTAVPSPPPSRLVMPPPPLRGAAVPKLRSSPAPLVQLVRVGQVHGGTGAQPGRVLDAVHLGDAPPGVRIAVVAGRDGLQRLAVGHGVRATAGESAGRRVLRQCAEQ